MALIGFAGVESLLMHPAPQQERATHRDAFAEPTYQYMTPLFCLGGEMSRGKVGL